jgi:hypothetical protein
MSAFRWFELWWRRWVRWLHGAWVWTRGVVAVLALIRFSLLIPAVLGLTLVVADQMVDILRAVGEDGQQGAVAWLLSMASFAGLTVWYAARTMLRFRFADNPASDPKVHPRLKRQLPRLLGIAMPGLLAVRVLALAISSSAATRSAATGAAAMGLTEAAARGGSTTGLWLFALALSLMTGLLALYVYQRRNVAEATGLTMLAVSEGNETRNLAKFRQLPSTTRRVFWGLALADAIVIGLFTWERFYQFDGPVMLGAPAVLLLGLGLTTVGGSACVYAANHHGLPILSLLLVWTALCSINNDNHMVRVTANSKSHGWLVRARTPAAATLPESPLAHSTVDAYFAEWWQELSRDEPPGGEPIPVVVVSAEGGGLRAAYWTAAVLAALEDGAPGESESGAKWLPASRHVFAISGVSGGSVGGAVYDAALARRVAADGGAVEGGAAAGSLRTEMSRVLGRDYLSATLGAALFPDLLQRFLPAPLMDDRAVELEHAFERAWASVYPDDPSRLSAPFHDLWQVSPHRVPLLFLNSTVVETGQRAINSPLSVSEPASTFADSVSIGQLVGTEMPLSTAALLSARFTYVSPAALLDTHRRGPLRWMRMVDGGYFDNSGAVTTQEIVRAIWRSYDAMRAENPSMRGMRVIVLHLPNEGAVASAALNAAPRPFGGLEFASEVLAPIETLLYTRGARGTQAVEYLRREPKVTVLSVRPCTVKVAAPLGWVLSKQVRRGMDDQLTDCRGLGANCAAARVRWLQGVIRGHGDATYLPTFNESPTCEEKAAAQSAAAP